MSNSFSARLLAWHAAHGRHDLPWQNTQDPYRVWLSEIMLQQTQVATVIPYYLRFLDRFATLDELAAAPIEEVMPLWSGLGYYARARNLHACAVAVMQQHGGHFPQDPQVIASLPGIGRSTANAIADFCFGAREPILDGNVKRVLARCFGVEGFPGTQSVERQLWQLAAELLPEVNSADYIQAQMDLGATLCTRSKPRCSDCPLAEICIAKREQRTTELPTKKPGKTIPQREARVLVLLRRHAGKTEVLLERRPPQGIWGGLLALPEISADGTPEQQAQKLGFAATEFTALAALQHTFTHFRLNLQPLLAHVNTTVQVNEADRMEWLALEHIHDAALPTPIKKILLDLHCSP